jgi:hypothetical protein
MGATTFFRTAYGNDPQEAYDKAYHQAESEKGHQDGYSGDLNSKNGFVVVNVPKDVKLTVWLKALSEDNLPQSLQIHAEEFARQHGIYDEKSEPALCFEKFAHDSKAITKQYVFVGTAPE